MKRLLTLISYLSLLCFIVSCVTPPEAESPSTKKLSESPYAKKLHASKATYPFERWKELYANGLTQYTEANCNACKQIFDDLIEGLIDAGENAPAETKLAIFKEAILKTNVLNEQCGYALIETGEREELCELTDAISIAAGLDPKAYQEGIASEWRDW